jgi:hypothetical protein
MNFIFSGQQIDTEIFVIVAAIAADCVTQGSAIIRDRRNPV